MLNEFYELSRSLERLNLLDNKTHPSVSKIGAKASLLIELDKVGEIKTARLLSGTESKKLWKHKKGNFNSFPAISVKNSLLSKTQQQKFRNKVVEGDKCRWNRLTREEKVKILSSLDWNDVESNGVEVKISSWSLEKLLPLFKDNVLELAALKQLVEVFPDEEHAFSFKIDLTQFVRSQIDTAISDLLLDYYCALAIGKWSVKEKKYEVDCRLYFDVYETGDFENKVIDQRTEQALIDQLNKKDMEQKSKGNANYNCVLSGKKASAYQGSYPKPNLPAIGETYLYSKNREIQSLTRYGLIGNEAFSSSMASVNLINDALAYITDPQRENKTWRAVNSWYRSKRDLLIAYLTESPNNDALLATILGSPDEYEDEREYQESMSTVFEDLCHQVIGSVAGEITKNPNSEVRLIILESVDQGRKQVVYEQSITVEQLESNLRDWARALRNCIDLRIAVDSERQKNRILEIRPMNVGPEQIGKIYKEYYTESGEKRSMGHTALTIRDAYRLYMPGRGTLPPSKVQLLEMLSMLLYSYMPLIRDMGNKMVSEKVMPKNNIKKVRDLAYVCSMLSILLWKLDVRKENYMNESPFNLGQMLQLSSRLHKLYCIYVRNGGDAEKKLPPQLIGSECLSLVSETPVEGLSHLKDRLRIYLAWAETYTGEKAGLVRWILNSYGEVAWKISRCDLPKSFGPSEQAQVLLGYLAEIPSAKSRDTTKGEETIYDKEDMEHDKFT